MGIVSTAVGFAMATANDPKSGYDQSSRWGPDYDCSSLVITAFKKAGVPLTCTYTGNMFSDMISHGFKNVTHLINLATGAGLIAGDVLLNVVHHTAMCIGNGQLVQASQNEFGGVTGGRTGDQTGGEINIRSYYNFPWNYVLRYEESGSSGQAPATPSQEIQNGSYTVKSGDTLWGIAEKFYGNGAFYTKIMTANGLISSAIHPGQTLKIPDKNGSTQTVETSTCIVSLPILKYGDTGMRVRKVQALLDASGYSIPVNGDFDSVTKNAVESFQKAKNLIASGRVDVKTYEALLS